MYLVSYFPFIILFSLLLFFCLRSTRSAIAPSSLLTIVWLFGIVGLLLSGETFYLISVETLFIYFFGAFCFSIGDRLGQLFALGFKAQTRLNQQRGGDFKDERFVVYVLILAALIVSLPSYMRSVVEGSGLDAGATLAQVRYANVEQGIGDRSFSLLRNFQLIAGFLAAAIYCERYSTPLRQGVLVISIIVAIVYGTAHGTKMSAVALFLILFFIRGILVGSVDWRATLLSAGLAVLAFSAGLFLINLSYTYDYEDIGFEVFSDIFALMQNYALGGLVAFDNIVEDSDVIESVHGLTRPFLELANALGASFDIPSIHAQFLSISPVQDTNTYTIYFTYYKDVGLLLAGALMLILGFFLGWNFIKAKAGNLIHIQLFAIFSVAIIFSVQSEKFVSGLSGHLKAIIFFFTIYNVLPRFLRALSKSKSVLRHS